MKYPVLLVEFAVEPRRDADRKRLEEVLAALSALSSEFSYSIDHESGQTIIRVVSEPKIAALVARLRGEFGIEANVGAAQVAYRETITKVKEHSYTYKRQTGGSGQFAKVKIRFESLAPGSGFEFENEVVGGTVPKEYIPGVEKGLKLAKESGVIAGFPMIDFKATLIDGAYHDVDSNVMTFDIAARACFREAIPQAGPKLLEPMMKVEVVTPEEYLGDVIGDLNSRRGQVQGMDSRGNAQVVSAMVPLANMFGYADDLSKMTRERAHFTMEFDHYQQIPSAVPPDDPFSGAMALRAGAKLA